MQERLLKRGKDSGRIDDNLNAISSRLTAFRNNTLPVLKHYDDEGKLVVVSLTTPVEGPSVIYEYFLGMPY